MAAAAGTVPFRGGLSSTDSTPAAGKTAPRLIQDLLTYDPRYEERAGRNLLTSPPPHHDPDARPVAAVPIRNCRHDLKIKPEQSASAPKDGPEPNASYKVATYCQKCRWHIDIIVDYRDNNNKNMPCGKATQDYVLHHFVFVHEVIQTLHLMGHPSPERTYNFQCSAPRCPVELRIRMHPPRFSEHELELLTNKAILRKRLDTAKQLVGDRADGHMARSVDALDYLGTYLNDSLNPQKGKSRIPVLNRKFVRTFGKDCDNILKNLGFSFEIEDEDGEPVEVWHLPKPPPAHGPLDSDDERTLIEDGQHEIIALLSAFPEAERVGVRHTFKVPQSALQTIEKTLACEDYQKKTLVGTRRATNHEEDHPYYAGLGAVGDFSDALLLFAYSRQVAVDLANSTYYFECLQDLAIGRKSDLLETQVQLLASNGQTNRKEVASAYRSLGMDPKHAHVLGDDHIIGQFKARLQDISPAAAEETRNNLRVIGNARNSEKIKLEASNAIETYEQALSWLDLVPEQADEFVETMYGIKVNDNPANREIATKAVNIIATHRKSRRLQRFLLTGTVDGGGEIDLGQAYALLQIQDRASAIDLSNLEQQVRLMIEENPGSEEKYEQAYTLIKAEQESRYSQSGFAISNKYPLESWPVGCLNIGNTCYLNSVLQFLFTIKPLRDMVLNCDDYMQDTSPEALKAKRVGRSAVTAEKVERAQQFLHELRGLFQRMITASTHSVRPEAKLAALALSKTTLAVADTTARNATEGPRLGDIEGIPVAGPMPPPEAASVTKENEFSAASLDTLVDTVMGDDAEAKDETSSTVAEIDVDEVRPMETESLSNGIDTSVPEPPSRPPPIPPRPLDIKKIEGLAEQQDAAEILNNVFDLFSCAITADKKMEDGEQWDLVKRLFFSNVTTVRLTNDTTARNSALQDTHHVFVGHRDRPLYAALDDEFSLSELESDASQNGAKTSKFEYIATASPIQIINVRRLIFEKGQATKLDSHIGLEDVLYLDRYLERTTTRSQEELQQLREKQWHLQRRLKSLESRKKVVHETEVEMDLPDAVSETATWFEDISKAEDENLIDVDEDPIPKFPNLPQQMHEKAQALKNEAKDIDEQMRKMDGQSNTVFEDCKDHPYVLHAVFMHRGSATGGHYWIYIRDFQNDVWREYNDEAVNKVDDLDKIFKQKDRATSTGLVFVKQDLVNKLTEAVCRKPEMPEPSQPQSMNGNEIEMTDVDKLPVLEGLDKEA
ncbi:cysteine proteinase [Lophiostoma macrostomum CBS 122681]|uniref:ubiquitinyl hydrolase 1 n=1 Tax=Lophiostoma macrostomum CBS 122681 TaxID=1314788 RepID=A0A6A6TCR2_9PLEO|nr:cysteine proteinase [Lophiostoma macrostomum CBS 122681]